MSSSPLFRLEIIANHTVEDALTEALAAAQVGQYYSLVPTIDGCGSSGARMGDGVWPEENFMLIIYASAEEAEAIVAVAREIKSLYPIEGLKVFRSPAEVLL